MRVYIAVIIFSHLYTLLYQVTLYAHALTIATWEKLFNFFMAKVTYYYKRKIKLCHEKQSEIFGPGEERVISVMRDLLGNGYCFGSKRPRLVNRKTYSSEGK